MRKLMSIVFSLILLACHQVFACPVGFVKVKVVNSATKTALELSLLDEMSLKIKPVTVVKPGKAGKYCMRGGGRLLMVKTLSAGGGGTVLAKTATDLFNDLIISTPVDKHPDVAFRHLRGDVKITDPKPGHKLHEVKDVEEADIMEEEEHHKKRTFRHDDKKDKNKKEHKDEVDELMKIIP